jgi:hypothetical protein
MCRVLFKVFVKIGAMYRILDEKKLTFVTFPPGPRGVTALDVPGDEREMRLSYYDSTV